MEIKLDRGKFVPLCLEQSQKNEDTEKANDTPSTQQTDNTSSDPSARSAEIDSRLNEISDLLVNINTQLAVCEKELKDAKNALSKLRPNSLQRRTLMIHIERIELQISMLQTQKFALEAEQSKLHKEQEKIERDLENQVDEKPETKTGGGTLASQLGTLQNTVIDRNKIENRLNEIKNEISAIKVEMMTIDREIQKIERQMDNIAGSPMESVHQSILGRKHDELEARREELNVKLTQLEVEQKDLQKVLDALNKLENNKAKEDFKFFLQ